MLRQSTVAKLRQIGRWYRYIVTAKQLHTNRAELNQFTVIVIIIIIRIFIKEFTLQHVMLLSTCVLIELKN